MSEQLPYNPIAASISYLVIFGTGLVIVIIATLLGISYYFMHSAQAPARLLVCAVAGIYIASAYVCTRQHYYHIAAYLLVLFYLLLASGIVWSWSINTPIGPLAFGLFIVLAGILLTARHALFAGITAGLVLVVVQIAATFNWHQPDTSWTGNQSNFGDVLAYFAVFGMLALVSWLYNRAMERALMQAKRAEIALRQQKATLKRQVEERTKDLRQAQLEEMRQMYRFAELGQLGVTLLHDLANHLTALTLEIEGIKDTQSSKKMARAQQITQYLGDLVDSTRQRLHGGIQKQTFDIIRKISETIDFLHYKAAQSEITIDWYPSIRSLKYTGDPDSFCQIIAILTNNAIDSYTSSSPRDKRRVVVTAESNDTHIIIRISDWGKGIIKAQHKQLFKPHRSVKTSGLGLGLYIAKQTIEMQFSGTITLSSRDNHTEFIIKLPLANGK